MATAPLSDAVLQEAVDTVREHGSVAQAARALKLARSTLQSRLEHARMRGISPGVTAPDFADSLRREVTALKAQLAAAERERLDTAYVRKVIFGLAETPPDPPKWLLNPASKPGAPGVPCLMWSDWHWGEVVSGSELGGVNQFNYTVAHARAKQLVHTTVDLLKTYTVNPSYPGVVLNLGGDMVTGDIHEELTNTNSAPIMPTVIDLFGVLTESIGTLADVFGRVFVPCVTGNHGRNTRKIQSKQRAYTSFDWLLYQLLDKHFQRDDRVTFYIPDSADAAYRVYGHRYLLTHGDQFRGGDGIIGPLGPIMRGDNKKRSRNSQMGRDYDTMVIGHFHQLMMLPRLIVNGSLKGYDEYAYQGNFPYEPPAQALWLTHPDLGITLSMPVFVERKPKLKASPPSWVSVPE